MARALMVLGALLLVAGCSSGQGGQAASEDAEGTSSPATETVTVTASSPTVAPGELTSIDPSSLASPHHAGTYVWNYSTGGQQVGLCVSGGDAVTCTGAPGAEIPDLTEYFPGRPGAVEVGAAGLRYTFVEGVPPVSAYLETGQAVQIGDLRCAKPDAGTLECSSGGNSFTISGPSRTISTSGTVLAERDYSNHPGTGAGTTSSSTTTAAASGQPSGYMGASGLVSGVRTASGALVTASVPPCDGRGILILDSYVESSDPQEGIAALLDRHPGAEFAMPGRCPSLRGSLDGARVYPIYTDHGHDTAALCRDKAARGGNARLLITEAEYIDPC